MKKYSFLLAFIFLFSVSCEDNLTDLNEDIKNPAEVPGAALFTGAQKELVDQLVTPEVNYNIFRLFAQYWTETTYTDESNYDLITRNIPEQHWSVLFRKVLRNLDEATMVINDSEDPNVDAATKQNALQVIEILKVFTFSVLVESFGDIPYTEALDIDNLLPRYDEAETIYQDLLARLDKAIGLLDPTAGSFGEADNIYQGDVSKWIKFANSLKLRMGLVIAEAPGMEALSRSTVESAVVGGVFTSNADNASMIYLSSPPNTNPVYINLVASGRNDFVVANTLVDRMEALDDPRMKYYFDENLDDPATPEVEYEGGIYGASNTFSLYTHVAPEIQEPIFPGTILSYSEVEFMLAEAVERGYNVPGTAEEHYNAGVTASILDWGGTVAEAEAYLAQPEVAYSTAEGPWEQKIGVQKWIALYNRGYAAWLSWRLLDYPVLEAPADAVSDIPLRLTYPIVEQTLNGRNYDAAAAAIGGDLVTTRLFFDVD